ISKCEWHDYAGYLQSHPTLYLDSGESQQALAIRLITNLPFVSNAGYQPTSTIAPNSNDNCNKSSSKTIICDSISCEKSIVYNSSNILTSSKSGPKITYVFSFESIYYINIS
ncbi:hypothetical protein, partial [Citrobacter braakii]|uniref:hypothetical protein n=1 Tax=Citrobacter braakii TaxID=57706 RepID=UPI001A954BF9